MGIRVSLGTTGRGHALEAKSCGQVTRPKTPIKDEEGSSEVAAYLAATRERVIGASGEGIFLLAKPVRGLSAKGGSFKPMRTVVLQGVHVAEVLVDKPTRVAQVRVRKAQIAKAPHVI